MKKSLRNQIKVQQSSSQQLNETFRFDSTMLKNKRSLYKSSCSNNPNPDPTSKSKKEVIFADAFESEHFSNRTSEIVRHIDADHQNILELLEESDNHKTTNKGNEEQHQELWEFFGRFEKQTNPSISLTQLNLSKDKNKGHSKSYKAQYKAQYKREEKIESEKQIIFEQQQTNISEYIPPSNFQNQEESAQIRRYPARNRIKPLRYWLNQRPIYHKGKLVGITSIIAQKPKK